jgi:hypothetical protein
MLPAFAELLAEYPVFKMAARVNAGYGKRHGVRMVTGYFSRLKSREADTISGALTENDRAHFYEQHDAVSGQSNIRQLEFIEAKGQIWRFVEDDNMGDEGGFTKWTCQRIAAFTGEQSRDAAVDLAADFS